MNTFIHTNPTFKALALICLLSFQNCQMKRVQNYESFGQLVEAEPVAPLQQVLNELDQSDTLYVKFTATIDQVCQNKGCWMTLESEEKVRVTFKDYGFFVPKDASGKNVIVEGYMTSKKLSEAEGRHLAEDAGIEYDPKLNQEISVVASGVLIEKKPAQL